jgi:small subunit ribosomal protein S9
MVTTKTAKPAADSAKGGSQPKADQPLAGAKSSGGKATIKKPRAVKKPVEAEKVVAVPAVQKNVHHRKPAAHEAAVEVKAETKAEDKPAVVELPAHKAPDAGRYIFATGRRKTSVANIRLFTGEGQSMVNKKPFDKYFSYSYYQDEINQAFQLTGLSGQYYFVCHVNGGGPHSQAGAVRHGISIALGKLSEEVRKVLKKNGLLTRDDRKKERKKPGLKRARRSPQWAKR